MTADARETKGALPPCPPHWGVTRKRASLDNAATPKFWKAMRTGVQTRFFHSLTALPFAVLSKKCRSGASRPSRGLGGGAPSSLAGQLA
jgi:hypothetical protein